MPTNPGLLKHMATDAETDAIMHSGYDNKNWQSLARRRLGRWHWITGSGPWAVVSYCPGGDTITLWQTRSKAATVLDGIDRRACGSRCRRAHHIVEFEAEAA